MPTSLKKLLGGSAARPIGSHVWFPDVDNSAVNPLYDTGSAVYLRSGNVLTDEETTYPEAFEKFGSLESNIEVWVPLVIYLSVIGFGNERFVGLSPSVAVYSDDSGETWGVSNTPVNGVWQSIAFGNDAFVVTPYNSDISFYSLDNGETWTASTLPFKGNWRGIAFGNGVFVTLAESTDKTAYSVDNGKTWTQANLPSSSNWSGIAFGNGVFVAVSYTSYQAAYSYDNGQTWTLSSPLAAAPSSVAFGGGIFLALKQGRPFYFYSVDNGQTWTQEYFPSGTNNQWYKAVYADGKFVVVLINDERVLYSADALTWGTAVTPSIYGYKDIVYGNNTFIAAQGNTSFRTLPSSLLGLPAEEIKDSAVKYMRIK
ncbi:sialidase family protein [Castellaniella sp.]|uniref:WD40/YVTN/BNR-like repeat-containing protein n=1 Tax=Castellaniella sp. TaxID=1955812 RepID=UPI002AFEA1B2|nr:sialidase family protein [Castellaniella sp.]